MKRWLILLILSVTLLTGCTGKTQVGICWRDGDDPLTGEYRQILRDTLQQQGYEITEMDAGNDQSKQDRQVIQLLKNKMDILILEPVMTSALDSVTQQVREASVPVVLVNRQPEELWENAVYIGCDPEQPGALQAQLALEDDINGDGILSYAYITGPEDHLDAKLRSDGCSAALKEAEIQAQCLALEYTDWSRGSARQRCASVLAKYGKDVEVIFCASEELALGAVDAIRDGGRTVGENIYLYGIGGQNQSRMLIRSGDLSGTVSDDIPTQLERVLAAIEDLLAGKAGNETDYVNHIVIDPTNVEDYIDN